MSPRHPRPPRPRRTLGPLGGDVRVPDPIVLVGPPALTTQYPHVDDITDWRAKQTIRLLWDRAYDLEGRLQAAEANLQQLTTRSNQQDQDVTSVRVAAGEALATALLSPSAQAALGGLSPGEPATGPGSKFEPIVPMSADLTAMEASIKASLYHWGRSDYHYWFHDVLLDGAAPWQGGDGKWYLGWDAYFEDRANPANTAGISSHDLLPLPSVYTTPPPSGYPTGGWT